MLDRLPPGGRHRFRRDLQVEFGDESVYVFDERGVSALHGACVTELARLLDGRRSDVAELGAARPGGLTAGQVQDVIGQLVDAGIVVAVDRDTGDRDDDPALAWWDGCRAAAAASPSLTAAVRSVGDPPGAAVARAALAASGIPEPAGPDAAGLDIVVCGDYLDAGLDAADAAQRAAGRPWLLARIDGPQLWIGPILQPGTTGCWHCLTHRLWAHRRPEAVVQRALGRQGPVARPSATLPAGIAAAAHLVALEAAKWLGGHRYAGQRSVWVLDSRSLTGSHHELQRRPQCPACGDAGIVARRARQPVRLAPARKVAGGGGGDRTLAPADMLARHSALVSPITGIVKEIVADPNAPSFVHAFRSGPNMARRVAGVTELRRSLRAENGGKGFTAVDAQVGALCEAAERYSALAQGDELRVRGSLASLGAAAVDPRRCQLFDERQYAERDEWNPQHSGFNHVPEPFDPAEEIDWTPLWSLTGNRHRLLPTAMLYFDDTPVAGVLADSNGHAAGSSLTDAALQGLLELVERDAVSLWWYNRTPVPGVDLSAFGDPRLVEQQDNHRGIGRELWVLDVSADLGVPVIVALSRRCDARDGERILLGFGAHPDPSLAVRRAIAELNQMLPIDGVEPEATADPDWIRWARHGSATAPHLRPDPAVALRTPRDHPRVHRADIRDEVDALVGRMAAAGMEVLVLDQTRPDVGVPVVKVVVAGMRSFWARFAPGRLFDVPVALGRVDRPTPYADLNPMPLFL
jgi:oxazoline/thiazoline synthase